MRRACREFASAARRGCDDAPINGSRQYAATARADPLPRTSSRRPFVPPLLLALVLTLHGAAWWLLSTTGSVAPRAATSIPVRVIVRWFQPPAPAPAPDAALSRRQPEPATNRPTPEARAPRAKAVVPAPTRKSQDEPPREAVAAQAAPPASAASAVAAPAASILDSAATRQAIVDAARAPSLANLPGTTPAEGKTQRLRSAIAAGARGDCDKGDFAGGGMGLLSVPFWAVAKLRGDCSK